MGDVITAGQSLKDGKTAINQTFADHDKRITNIVANAGSSNTEIVDARQPAGAGNPFDTLKDRLDDADANFTAHLADDANKLAGKADISYVDTKTQGLSLAYKESYSTLSALQAAYPTGDVYNHAVLADGYIYTYVNSAWTSTQIQANGTGLAAGSVTGDKTSFMSVGKNLFNKATAISGQYVLYSSGGLAAGASYYASDYIPVRPNTNYTRQICRQMAFYDANKTYISGINTDTSKTPFTFTTPANAAFVRISVYSTEINTEQVEIGSTRTTYESFGYYLNQSALPPIGTSNLDDDSVTIPKAAFLALGLNLFNQDTVSDGYYVDASVGVLTANSSYAASDYIPVQPNTTYSASHNRQMAFYDANKTYLSGINDSPAVVPKTFTTPANAAFMRISIVKSTTPVSAFIVALGNTLPLWEPYAYYLDPSLIKTKQSTIYNDIDVSSFLLFLPSEICIAVGRTIELYNKQVAWCGNPDNYHFQWICDIGSALKRKWSCAATSGMVGNHTLTCNVYDNDMNQVATATTTVKVVNFSVATAKKVVPIGDSLTNGKGWLAEVRNLASNNISFVGTRWNGDVQGGYLNHEGRSGATAGWYLGNNTYTFDTNGVGSENPFWNPGTSQFDFGYYKSHYSITPDIIQIYLGTNGIDLDPTINVNNIKAIVNGIRANDSNIPIFVVFTLYRGDQNGIGKQTDSDGYSAGSGVWKLQEDRKVYNLMAALYNALKSYTNLYFTPISLAHDSEYNFKDTVETPVNPRSTITELEDHEATHPSARPEGYLQMADIMFSAFAAHLS